MRYFTGIGSRTTPLEVQTVMTEIARIATGFHGYFLRSGGAEGADKAFEKGAKKKEIFLASDATREAAQIARKTHPNWEDCDALARKYHSRNVMQVLGRDLSTPSDFLVCWTKDGKAIGGTRTAIMVAAENGIPIFNLAKPYAMRLLEEFLVTQYTSPNQV